MVQPLHLIKWEHIPLSHQNGFSVLDCFFLVTDQVPPFPEWKFPLHMSYSIEWPALTSDMEGTNPLTMTEWLSPYIWPTCQNGYGSQHSYLTWKESNPLTVTEWLSPYIWPTHQNGYGTHHFPFEETSIWRTPIFSLRYSNFTLANVFVNTLAICSSVATYWSFTTPLYTISLI